MAVSRAMNLATEKAIKKYGKGKLHTCTLCNETLASIVAEITAKTKATNETVFKFIAKAVKEADPSSKITLTVLKERHKRFITSTEKKVKKNETFVSEPETAGIIDKNSGTTKSDKKPTPEEVKAGKEALKAARYNQI